MIITPATQPVVRGIEPARHDSLPETMRQVSPERFTNEAFLSMMQRCDVALFAVDEAHCISEWGHSFRPDYLRLARFARECGAKSILALTGLEPPCSRSPPGR